MRQELKLKLNIMANQSLALSATLDTGADISAAGLDILDLLNDYEENLLV